MSAPHIERMKEELAQLADRLSKLAAFIVSSPIFKQLPEDERQLMEDQAAYMRRYHDTLQLRIEFAERSQ